MLEEDLANIRSFYALEGFGMAEVGPAVVERNTVDKESFQIALKAEQVKLTGNVAQFSLDLPERAAWKITIPLKGEIVKGSEVSRTQYFAPDLLHVLRRGERTAVSRRTLGILTREPYAAHVTPVPPLVAVPEGRAANQPLSETTFSPPMGPPAGASTSFARSSRSST